MTKDQVRSTEVSTTRDIARQILRHRSFSFQEFSQRYADATQLGEFAIRECRMQDHKNRQNSLETDDFDLTVWWAAAQARVIGEAEYLYGEALHRGIAKEQARAAPVQSAERGEPVAWRWTNGKGWLTYGEIPHDRFESTPLYTAPVAQRQWVGLTEQEAAECWSTSTVRTWQTIEAKLKEKNK